MKWVSMLTVCGLFGVHSLGGMMIKERKNQKIPTLFQLCIAMVADHITDLRSESTKFIEWGDVPDDVKHPILSHVNLDKNNVLFWIQNVSFLEEQERKEFDQQPQRTLLFKDLSKFGTDHLLSLPLDDLASLVIQDSFFMNKLNLPSLVRSLPSVTTNKKMQNPFPASVVRHQRFFNQPLDVNCNGMNASLDRDSSDLIIRYEDDIKLVIPTHNDDSKRATALRFNNNAGKFVAGFKGGKVRLYNTADNSEKEITEHSLAVTAVALSSDEDIVASASINGELCLSSISAGTHIKMWVDNLVSKIDFEGNNTIKLTMDRVVSRSIPLGSMSIIDDQIVSKSVPLQYLKGKLTNKELLVAYIAKRKKYQNEELKHTAAAQLGLFMDTNNLFEPIMREYFRGIITGKDK